MVCLMFERAIGMDLSDEINAGQKVVILYGPRQVGKTTLVKEVLSHSSKRFFQVNADEKKYSDLFSSRDLTKIQGAIHGYEGLFIDEAQRIPEIGLNLKLIHDSLPGFPIVVTGSSSFELANQVQEPLTGRAWSHLLFPMSVYEFARQLGLSKETVSHYIDLLEKSFVVFRLRGFSRNLRNEVTKMDKSYFVDLGIPNAILGNFNPLERRDDVGKLWENFLISERRKTLSYTHQHCRPYFWRTHVGTEIDYVEETGSELMGYEFKWGELRAADALRIPFQNGLNDRRTRQSWPKRNNFHPSAICHYRCIFRQRFRCIIAALGMNIRLNGLNQLNRSILVK